MAVNPSEVNLNAPRIPFAAFDRMRYLGTPSLQARRARPADVAPERCALPAKIFVPVNLTRRFGIPQETEFTEKARLSSRVIPAFVRGVGPARLAAS
jgi:hypothetical protein